MDADHRATLGDAPRGGDGVARSAFQRIGLIEHMPQRRLAAGAKEDRVAQGGDLGQVAHEGQVLGVGFAEAEAVTIASDPALANAFNVQPNTASLELLGVLGSRAEEKSDAEVRAEQVVAANKEQQDAINANYMDADQSGIVAAIGAEADVSSYLSQRLQDVPFYKPEDIYKGVIIKDNVRGSYFLEKGNTDTYKKMVEEQYK